jgi:hypothetical protein
VTHNYVSLCLSVYQVLCLIVHLSIYICVYLYVYLSICLSVYLPVCLYIYRSIFVYQSVCLYIYLSIFVYQSVCLPVYQSIRLLICQAASLCISLSVHPSFSLSICNNINGTLFYMLYNILVTLQCGQTSSENCTYLTLGDTGTTNLPTNCVYTLCPINQNVCRIRLDFMVM